MARTVKGRKYRLQGEKAWHRNRAARRDARTPQYVDDNGAPMALPRKGTR